MGSDGSGTPDDAACLAPQMGAQHSETIMKSIPLATACLILAASTGLGAFAHAAEVGPVSKSAAAPAATSVMAAAPDGDKGDDKEKGGGKKAPALALSRTSITAANLAAAPDGDKGGDKDKGGGKKTPAAAAIRDALQNQASQASATTPQ